MSILFLVRKRYFMTEMERLLKDVKIQSLNPLPSRYVYDDGFADYLKKINKVLPTNKKLNKKG